MASKLLTKGSELYGKRKEDAEQGLMGKWAGSSMASGGIIAPSSKGRQYQGVDGGSMHRRCAPIRKDRGFPSLSKDMTGGPSQGRDGYGKVQ